MAGWGARHAALLSLKVSSPGHSLAQTLSLLLLSVPAVQASLATHLSTKGATGPRKSPCPGRLLLVAFGKGNCQGVQQAAHSPLL
jgi:hypothetical protein